MLDEILLNIQKPGRYIGNEWNVSRKDFDRCGIKFALCFPDLYEVGMSNLGIRIIYGLLNNIDDVCCERFFSPGADLERALRNSKSEIFSLESGRKLSEFDLIGISLAHELLFTNILNILNLGNIPLEAALRDADFPLVIGGGPCMVNPEPMHVFFDIFIIGEAEDALLELIDLYRAFKIDYKRRSISKQDLLLKCAKIEGVYVPSLYEDQYDEDGNLVLFKPKIEGLSSNVKKRFIADLDKSYFPVNWLVPYIQTIHDRITLEVMRGCPNRCRFCQARQQYFPFRQKSVQVLFNAAVEIFKSTGYEEMALGGLSVSDYGCLEELLRKLICEFKEKGVSVSLPSIKPAGLLGEASSLIATIKKTGLTFAPEAATDKLRRILGKDFSEADFFKVIEQAFASGYQHVKLYFMIGLPQEEESDLAGIVDFAVRVSDLRKKFGRYPAKVNLSVNTLIPKPHTPFQWFGMPDLEIIKNKQDYLKARLYRNRNIKISFHNRFMSFFEGVLSRGDRRLSPVILEAFNMGARFDAWEETFSFERWMEAFKRTGLEPDFYLKDKRELKLLPWDFLDIGVRGDFLRAEFNKIIDI